MLAAKEFEGETTEAEKWYGTPYKVVDLDDNTLSQWTTATEDKEWIQPTLAFPERNDMIATDFSLRELTNAPKDEPRLLLDAPSCRLWYKIDNVFSMPKVNVMASLRTSVVYESPESSVCTALLVEILHEQCNEFA
jgi:secreted Zn-dependent insulinase-like peptidase